MKNTFSLYGILFAAILSLVSCSSDDEEISDAQSDELDSVGEISNAFSDSSSVMTRVSEPFAFDEKTTCSISFSTGNPKSLTLGSGDIDGTFDGSDYDFAHWDLAADQPKEVDLIAEADFSEVPSGVNVCSVGAWEFSGKVTWDENTNILVQHLWRHLSTTTAAHSFNFFGHIEMHAEDIDADTTKVDNLKFVRARWLNNGLVTAQTGVSVGDITSIKEGSGLSTKRVTSGKLCVHHLLKHTNSFHVFNDLTRKTGFGNFCCHPLSGQDTISVFSESQDCSAGLPDTKAQTKLHAVFPDKCGDDITLEILDVNNGDVTTTIKAPALCTLI